MDFLKKNKYISYLCIICIIEICLFFVFDTRSNAEEGLKNDNYSNYSSYENSNSYNSSMSEGAYDNSSDIYDASDEKEDNFNKSKRIEALKKSSYYGKTLEEMAKEYDDYYVKDNEKVADDYFDNATFIGDFRMVSFEKSQVIKKADFITDVNMTVQKFNDNKLYEKINEDSKKVYIQLGYNDIANISIDDFVSEYSKMIKNIKERTSNACIYVQSIIYVSSEKSSNNKIHSNRNIDAYNYAILSCIKENEVYYQDINSLVIDDNNALQDRLSEDGININDFCCEAIYVYLKNYTISE